MATLYSRTGEPVEVPDEQAQAALASGDFGLPKGRINVVTPEGLPESVPSEHVSEALSKGYSLETAKQAEARIEEKKYGDRPIAAGLAGAGRGLTLGLSDLALTKSGLVSPKTLEGLDEHNKLVSKGAEYGAMAATALIPGLGEKSAVGLAGKLGHAAEHAVGGVLGEGLAAKAAAATIKGGVEGTLFGLGSAVSESSLGDTELTAQTLVAGAGIGALSGGLLTGGLKLSGAGFGSLLRRGVTGAAEDAVVDEVAGAAAHEAAPAAAKTAEHVAEGAADAAATEPVLPGMKEAAGSFGEVMGAIGKGGKPVGKILDEQGAKNTPVIKRVMESLDLQFPTKENWVLRDLDIQRGAGQKLREKGLHEVAPRMLLDDARYAETKTLPQKLALITTKKNEAATAIGESVSKFDALAKPEEAFDTASVAAKIRAEIITPLERGPAMNRSIIEKIEAEAAKLEEQGGANGLSFKEAEELKRSFDPHLNWDATQTADTPIQSALKKVRGIVNGEIESKVGAIAERSESPEILSEWKDAKKSYGAMKQLERPVEKRVSAREGNRLFGLTDNIFGAVGMAAGGGFNPIGMAMGGAAALANKWARERLPQVIALTLRRMETEPAMGMAAEAFHEKIGEAIKTGAHGAFGRYGDILAAAAGRSAADLMATHAALSVADPEYAAQMAKAGFAPESAEEAAGLVGHAKRLLAIKAAVDAHNARIDSALGRFLGSTGGAVPKREELGSREEQLKSFETQAKNLEALTSNPDAMVSAIQPGGMLTRSAPGVAAAASATTATALQFLQSKIPKNPHPEALPALERQWKPSGAELARWGRYVGAINNPLGVLNDLKSGSVSKESVEALRAVYPRLLQDIQTKAMEKLAGHGKPITYRQRQALSVLMGAPTGGAGNPARMEVFQQAHHSAQKAKAAADSNRKMKLAEGMATSSQRIEGR